MDGAVFPFSQRFHLVPFPPVASFDFPKCSISCTVGFFHRRTQAPAPETAAMGPFLGGPLLLVVIKPSPHPRSARDVARTETAVSVGPACVEQTEEALLLLGPARAG